MNSILKPTHTAKRMKTKLILATAIGLALNHLNAQGVPNLVNYQGKVTDNAGVGIGTGTAVNRQIIFRIFEAVDFECVPTWDFTRYPTEMTTSRL